jgi:hypothetical protein
VSLFDSAFMLGSRRRPTQGQSPRFINFYLGGEHPQILPSELQALRRIMRARLVVRRTGCAYFFEADEYSG